MEERAQEKANPTDVQVTGQGKEISKEFSVGKVGAVDTAGVARIV